VSGNSSAPPTSTPRRQLGRASAASIAIHTSGTHTRGHRMFEALCTSSGADATRPMPPISDARTDSPRVRRNTCINDAAIT